MAQRTIVRMLAMFHSGTSGAGAGVVVIDSPGMRRGGGARRAGRAGTGRTGRSAAGEGPGVLALLVVLVVVVGGGLGAVVGERVGAVAVAVLLRDWLRRGVLVIHAGVRLVGALVLAGHVLAADAGDRGAELVGVDQHVARLGPLGGAHDLAGLEQVHQAPRLREADAQLALQHRGGAELGGDHELRRL